MLIMMILVDQFCKELVYKEALSFQNGKFQLFYFLSTFNL